MKIKILIALFLFACTDLYSQQINFQGRDYFINGINVPWNKFGWDFGLHHTWGSGYDEDYFENMFEDLEANGINCVRIWLHCDGRASPDFDTEGKVTGFDFRFLSDLKDFMDRAEAHHILVIATLWSFDMLENDKGRGGSYAGMHADLITEKQKMDSYLENALIPMLQYFKDQCNLLAWEIISEPEWGMDVPRGGKTEQVVSIEEMQYFVGRCIETIRAHTDQLVTLGAAMPVGNELIHRKNYWHESEFGKLGFACNEVYLDFYSIHYFDWMPKKFSPFENNAASWNLNRPVLIAESAVRNDNHTDLLSSESQLENAWDGEYAGIVFWSYDADDEYSEWQHCEAGLFEFCKAHEDKILYQQDCDASNKHPLLVCHLFPNPSSDLLYIRAHHFEEGEQLQIIFSDISGKQIKDYTLLTGAMDEAMPIDISNIPVGQYFVGIYLKEGSLKKTIYRAEKLMVLRASN